MTHSFNMAKEDKYGRMGPYMMVIGDMDLHVVEVDLSMRIKMSI